MFFKKKDDVDLKITKKAVEILLVVTAFASVTTDKLKSLQARIEALEGKKARKVKEPKAKKPVGRPKKVKSKSGVKECLRKSKSTK